MALIVFFCLLAGIVVILLGYTVWKKELKTGIASAILAVIGLIMWFMNSYTEVQTGHGGVVKTFGKIELTAPVLTEGLNWVKPWQSVDEMSHQQISFARNASDGNAATVQAKDKIPLEVDASFHSILSYDAMPWIRQNYGEKYWDQLLFPSAASAIRSAASTFDDWDELQVDRRIDFQNLVTETYAETVRSKMRAKGIPENVVMTAFEFPTVDLRRIMPTDEELINQIAQTKAATEKTVRKETEILNAALDARKRGQDGTAIRDTILRVLYPADLAGALPENVDLPAGVTLAEISQFIMAIAEVKRADAVEIAAEKGTLTVMVTGNGANTSLPLPGKPATVVPTVAPTTD